MKIKCYENYGFRGKKFTCNEWQVSNSGGRNRVRIIITTVNPNSLLRNCSYFDLLPKRMCHLYADMCPCRWNGLQIQATKCHRFPSQVKGWRHQRGSLVRATCFHRSSCPSSKRICMKTIWVVHATRPQPGSFLGYFAWNACVWPSHPSSSQSGPRTLWEMDSRPCCHSPARDLEWAVLARTKAFTPELTVANYSITSMTSLQDFTAKLSCNKTIFSPWPLTASLYVL